MNSILNKTLIFSASATAALAFGALAGHSADASTIYSVQQNDTLNKIASKYNTSADALASANNIQNKNMIFVGQQLTISDDASTYTSVQATPTQVQSQTPVATQANVTATPVAQVQATQVQQQVQTAPVQATTQVQATTTTSSANTSSAKAWIANRESGNSYSARNGQYVGKYQLSADKLHGDYSAANQERVADQYANSRYGGWDNAKAFWQTHGWY